MPALSLVENVRLRRHPLQLAALALMIVLATTPWTGVTVLTQQARESLSQNEDTVAARFHVVRTDGQPVTVNDFVALRRAGLCVAPWLEVQHPSSGNRVIGVDPLAMNCFDASVGNAQTTALEGEPFVDISSATKRACNGSGSQLFLMANRGDAQVPPGYELRDFSLGPPTGELADSFLLNLDALGLLVLLITALLVTGVVSVALATHLAWVFAGTALPEAFTARFESFSINPGKRSRTTITQALAATWNTPDVTVRDNASVRALASQVFDQTFLLTRAISLLTLLLAALALMIMSWVFFTTRARYLRLLGIWLTWVLVHRINPLAFGWSLPMDLYPPVLAGAGSDRRYNRPGCGAFDAKTTDCPGPMRTGITLKVIPPIMGLLAVAASGCTDSSPERGFAGLAEPPENPQGPRFLQPEPGDTLVWPALQQRPQVNDVPPARHRQGADANAMAIDNPSVHSERADFGAPRRILEYGGLPLLGKSGLG